METVKPTFVLTETMRSTLRFAALRSGMKLKVNARQVQCPSDLEALEEVGLLTRSYLLGSTVARYEPTRQGLLIGWTTLPLSDEALIFCRRAETQQWSPPPRWDDPERLQWEVVHPINLQPGDWFLRSMLTRPFQPQYMAPQRIDALEGDGRMITARILIVGAAGERDSFYSWWARGVASPALRVMNYQP